MSDSASSYAMEMAGTMSVPRSMQRMVTVPGVSDRLLEVVEDQPPLLHAGHDGGKVVLEQDHVGGLLGHVRPSDAHGHPYVRLLQRWRVVHSVPRDCHNRTHPLTAFHYDQLLLRRSSGKDNLRVMDENLVDI